MDMQPIIDPRKGDIESDASSSKQRSILSLAGSLLTEISIPKLVVAWFVLLGFPAFLLGALPIAASIWFDVFRLKLSTLFQGLMPAILLAIIVAVGLLGGRRLFRLAERSFWSLNSLAVQPVYAIGREILNQLGDRLLPTHVTQARRATWRAATAALAGALVCLASVAIFCLVFPHILLVVEFSALHAPWPLVKGAIANSVAIVSAYVAIAAIVWAFADATMPPTRDFDRFVERAAGGRTWRVAHLSDIHAVGENFGFRIESGRSGPRGNDRLRLALERMDAIHAQAPLDAVLVTGDITDAGLSSEWAEFLTILESFPRLAGIMLVIPGNHDLNVVNRANPAQFDLPTSPFKKLRKLRVLSALNVIQGARVRVVDRRTRRLGATLDQALMPCVENLARFADAGRPQIHSELDTLWANTFPMVLPPEGENGLGIVLMNSNADAHFSFTNALGMVSADQLAGVRAAFAQYPRAAWIVCVHHHVVEYPRSAEALSERIGTALINGQWFVRRMQTYADRIIIMHGHRHIDWFGECGALPIFSAPSTVMGDDRDAAARFYIHTIELDPDGRVRLLRPQPVAVEGPHAPGSAAV